MALHGFRVENQRSIKLAEVAQVPRVMVIAGPNGVGKSTLLYAIRQGPRQEDPGTVVLYQGPHRVMRSTSVQRRWVGGALKTLSDLLGAGDVSGFEGLNFQNSARTPTNVDEAGSTIKHILAKVENRRQALLASSVDKMRASGRNLNVNELPDVYEPLKELTEFILPHLKFSKIDFENEDNIRCLFARNDTTGTVPVDLDDLSSGEKAVVVLFLPLLEERLQANLRKLETFDLVEPEEGVEPPTPVHRVMLIDEPEQHLHPDLQAKVLGYMRRLSEETTTQFIITSHSPTILDQAFDNELYVLNEPSPDDPGGNQLSQISTNAERLEALKQLAGSAYFLTTGRVVVCIEGERDADPEKPTDARLLSLLYPRATSVTLVPTTGKGNVITTVQRLREHLAEETFRIRVRGLIDTDQSNEDIEGVEKLPVCMIENLLLDPQSLFEFMTSSAPTAFADVESVQQELQNIAMDMQEKEIALRLRSRIKPKLVRLSGTTPEELQTDLARQISELQATVSDDQRLQSIIDEARAAVSQIIDSGEALKRFRGKELLTRFHVRNVSPLNIGYNKFCIEIAKLVSSQRKIDDLLDPVFDKLLAD